MFDTLLLAVDINDPEGAERPTQAACAMASREGAVLNIVNVMPDDGMAIVSASLGENHAESMMEQTRVRLADWAVKAIPDGIEAQLHVVRGTVYDQILRTATELGVGGIFVGAHRPALKDYLIGPNAARVARHATQSVFVIR
ncbi:universal stress protein [Roseobacteraceae bacterium S113]